MNNYCEGLTEKDKEESRRNTVVFQDFLTQYFAVRTSNKIQELVGGAITQSPAKFDEKTCVNPYVDRFLLKQLSVLQERQ